MESINVYTNKYGRKYYTIGKSYVKYDIDFPLHDAIELKDMSIKIYTCADCGDKTICPDIDLFILWNPSHGNWYCNNCFDEHICDYMDENNEINYAPTEDIEHYEVGPEHCWNCDYNMVNDVYTSPCLNCVKFCKMKYTNSILNEKIGSDDWNEDDEYIPYEVDGIQYKKIHKRFTDEKDDDDDLETDYEDMPDLISCSTDSISDIYNPNEITNEDIQNKCQAYSHYSKNKYWYKFSNEPLYEDIDSTCSLIGSYDSCSLHPLDWYEDDIHSVNSDYTKNCPIYPM